MVGFRTNIGYFEHRVIHHLLLQSEVIAVFRWLTDRAGRISIELRRWRWARGQVRIEREYRIRQVAECGEEGRNARRKRRVRIRKDVVMEYTESRPQDRFSASVEAPSKADSRLEVLLSIDFVRTGDGFVP